MARRGNYRSRSAPSRSYSGRRSGGGRRPSGRTVRRTGVGKRTARHQTVKIQLQVVAPPTGATGLPSESQVESKAAKAKF
nr:MAG: hypothetical protein [Microvirus sp.]